MMFMLIIILFSRLFEVINAMIDDLHTLDHQVEHSNVATIDHIKNLLNKIEKREDKSETRIENIEALIKQVSICLDYIFLFV